MSRLNSLWLFVRRHKYLMVTALIILIVGVVDENSFLNRFHHRRKLDQLRREIQLYQDQYDLADLRMKELDANPYALEKVARERYYMRRPGEDVFVVIDAEEVAEEPDTTSVVRG